MKNYIVIAILAIIPFVLSCGKDETETADLNKVGSSSAVEQQPQTTTKLSEADQNKLRQKAWNYIGAKQQSRVTTQWSEAVIEEVKYDNKSVYGVIFNTLDDALLGVICIYVNKSDLSVLGQAARY